MQIDILLHTVVVDNTDQLLALEAHHQVESSIETISPLLGGAAFLVEQDANSTAGPGEHRGAGGLPQPGAADRARPARHDAGRRGRRRRSRSRPRRSLDTALPTINLAYVPVQNVTRADVTGYHAYTQPVLYYEHLHPVG